MKPMLALHLGCAAALIALTSTGLAADWPRWRGPEQNGISAEKILSAFPAEGPKKLWQAPIGTGFSSMSVSGGRVYAMGNQNNTDTLWCLEESSGKVVWKQGYPATLDPNLYEGGPNATPTIEGGRAYIFSRAGDAYCFDAATGKPVWTAPAAKLAGAQKPEWGFTSSPHVEGNLVILNIGASGMALDKATGKLAWKSGPAKAGYSTPLTFSAGGKRAVALFNADTLFALNPADGKVLWQLLWKTDYGVNAADPVVVGDKLFISSGYGFGSALVEAATGRVLWQNKNMRNQMNSSVVIGGNAYGVDGNNGRPDTNLRCVDVATGAVKWTHLGFGVGSVAAAGETLVILGDKGQLALAQATPSGYKELAKAQILGGKCWTVPVIANGRLYARNAAGGLVCLDLAAK